MKENFNKQRIYLDLEYVYPGMTKESGRPSDKHLRQIVQIAAILFDHNKGEEVGSFNILTFPAYEKKLPSFFIELTGISQEDLDKNGISFELGLEKFVNFCQDYEIWIFDKDENVLRQNCKYFGLDFPFGDSNFIRVKPKLKYWRIDPEKYSSGTLYKAVNLDLKGKVHNALHDVRSMAQAVHELEKNYNI